MTVKELKEELAKLPDDSKVVVMMSSGCCGDTEDLEVDFADSYEPSKHYGGSLNIRVAGLPGYESCRSAYRMRELAKEIQAERDARDNSSKKDS